MPKEPSSEKNISSWWSPRLKAGGMDSGTVLAICQWLENRKNKDSLFDVVVGRESRESEAKKSIEIRDTKAKYRDDRALVEETYAKELKRIESLDKKEQETKKNAAEKERTNALKKINAAMNEELDSLERRWKETGVIADFWPHVRAYVRCIVPNAEVDPAHFSNICPVCGYRSEEQFVETVNGIVVRRWVEFNQVCHNCGCILAGFYVSTCPFCNSGNSRPIKNFFLETLQGSKTRGDAIWELTPRVFRILEDLTHYPPFSPPKGVKKDWEREYKIYTSPEFRYFLICPICLYQWTVVFWFPDQFFGKKKICSACGEQLIPTKVVREDGAILFVCSNPRCNGKRRPDMVESGAKL